MNLDFIIRSKRPAMPSIEEKATEGTPHLNASVLDWLEENQEVLEKIVLAVLVKILTELSNKK